MAAGPLLAAAGCSSGGEKAESAGRPAKVTYLTGVGLYGRESYAHVAVAKGFFADANIEVDIQSGKAGDFNNQAIAAGRAQFASVDSAGAFIRSGQGDTSARAVAAIHQRTVITLFTLEGSGITSPRHLPGRTIGVTPGAAPKTLFPAYAQLADIDAKTISWRDADTAQLPALLVAGKVDAVALFITATPGVQKAAKGRKVIALPYSEYLTSLYGNVLITGSDLITSDPDLVRRFTGALAQGLRYTMEHPVEAGQIINKAVPDVDPDVASQEVQAMRPYVLPPDGGLVGVLTPERVAQAVSVLESLGLMPTMRPEQLVDFDLVPQTA